MLCITLQVGTGKKGSCHGELAQKIYDKITNMKKKVVAKKKGSPVWLIIFLCLIIVGLVWLVTYSKNLGETSLLNEEIERLSQELEQLETNRQIETEKLKETISSLSTPSASPSTTSSGSSGSGQGPSAAPSSTPSAKLETKTATFSGEENK